MGFVKCMIKDLRSHATWRSMAVLILMLAVMTPTPAFAEEASDDTVKLIGHRGYSSEYPENTMPAFKGAYKAGFVGIEFDVWESDNGDLMVFHDYTTGRMCRGKSDKIWHVNNRNRKKSRYRIPYKDKTVVIPNLSEVLKLAAKHPGMVLLHIKKQPGKYRLSNAGVRKIVRLIKKYRVKDRVVVFTSVESDIKRFVGKGVRVGRQSSSHDRAKVNKAVRWLEKNKGDTLVITYTDTMRQDDFGSDLVEYCHKKGIQVGTYYAYTADDLDFLNSIKADFAMSDWYLPDLAE
ncbi:MAG: hypothetical protein IKF07_08105 [Eubacterium sp.]|nr:hypothetical protein [Eubacterium sp.]